MTCSLSVARPSEVRYTKRIHVLEEQNRCVRSIAWPW